MSKESKFFPPIPNNWVKKIKNLLKLSGKKLTPSGYVALSIIMREFRIKGRIGLKISHTTYLDLPMSSKSMNKILEEFATAGIITLEKSGKQSPVVFLNILPETIKVRKP